MASYTAHISTCSGIFHKLQVAESPFSKGTTIDDLEEKDLKQFVKCLRKDPSLASQLIDDSSLASTSKDRIIIDLTQVLSCLPKERLETLERSTSSLKKAKPLWDLVRLEKEVKTFHPDLAEFSHKEIWSLRKFALRFFELGAISQGIDVLMKKIYHTTLSSEEFTTERLSSCNTTLKEAIGWFLTAHKSHLAFQLIMHIPRTPQTRRQEDMRLLVLIRHLYGNQQLELSQELLDFWLSLLQRTSSTDQQKTELQAVAAHEFTAILQEYAKQKNYDKVLQLIEHWSAVDLSLWEKEYVHRGAKHWKTTGYQTVLQGYFSEKKFKEAACLAFTNAYTFRAYASLFNFNGPEKVRDLAITAFAQELILREEKHRRQFFALPEKGDYEFFREDQKMEGRETVSQGCWFVPICYDTPPSYWNVPGWTSFKRDLVQKLTSLKANRYVMKAVAPEITGFRQPRLM